MDISSYTKQTGTFLKAEEVSKNPSAVGIITEEGSMVVSEKFGNERLHLPIKFGDEDRIFDVSKTNARFIEEKLGAITNMWIGKSLVLETYKTKTSDGKLVEAINVKSVK